MVAHAASDATIVAVNKIRILLLPVIQAPWGVHNDCDRHCRHFIRSSYHRGLDVSSGEQCIRNVSPAVEGIGQQLEKMSRPSTDWPSTIGGFWGIFRLVFMCIADFR